MDRTWPVTEIEYPDGDGQPMTETPWHGRWMMRLLNLFERRYRSAARGYIASNLMVYYTKGEPRHCFAPDLIVLLASDRQERSVLKLWEEPQPPNLVVEVTSKSTRRRDYRWKMKLYAELEIAEYVLYDPTSDYLSPPLHAYRRGAAGQYEPIPPDNRQRLCSEQTGVAFLLDEHGQLALEDVATGELLLTDFEAEREARQREREARLLVEARYAELEAELRRLRGQHES
jgi:Uma2 family endonuclease